MVSQVAKPLIFESALWFSGSVQVCGYGAVVSVERRENSDNVCQHRTSSSREFIELQARLTRQLTSGSRTVD